MVEAGFDVERGWGKRPSMARDYIYQKHVMLGNTRIGPDLSNFGMRSKTQTGYTSIFLSLKQSSLSPFVHQVHFFIPQKKPHH